MKASLESHCKYVEDSLKISHHFNWLIRISGATEDAASAPGMPCAHDCLHFSHLCTWMSL